MKIECLQTGMLSENTYFIIGDNAVVVVDPGASQEQIFRKLDALNLPVCAVLLTHAHFDHITSARALQTRGAKVYLHADDVQNLPAAFSRRVAEFTPDVTVADGDRLQLAGMVVTVVHTPGHTAGSVCYLCDDALFTGDTLFCGDIGRCDLPSGSFETMKKSLTKIFSSMQQKRVLPGHGEETSLDAERRHNPYVHA